MKQLVTAFQLGTSTVITLPRVLGVVPGQKLEIKKEKQKIILRINREEATRKLILSLSGGLKLKKHLTASQLDDLYEKSYEKMLPGR